MFKSILMGVGAVVVIAWSLAAFGIGHFIMTWTKEPMVCVPKETK